MASYLKKAQQWNSKMEIPNGYCIISEGKVRPSDLVWSIATKSWSKCRNSIKQATSYYGVCRKVNK